MTPRRAAPEADATRDLYERYARQIYTYCLHQLGNREEAEDAVQSTFLNAFRGFQRGVDPEFESAWIYKIAQNVCLTRQRSSSRRRRVETASDLDAMQDYVPAHEIDADELINLPEALDAMPHQQRKALLLREWQGLSYREIAEELGLTQAAVETLLFRARRSLAAGLSEEPVKKSALQRLRTGGDAGSMLALFKTLLFTGGAKVAAAVATVAATSVVAATPAARHAVEDVVAPSHHGHAKPHQIARTPGSGGAPATSRVVLPSRLAPASLPVAATPAVQAPLERQVAHTNRHASGGAPDLFGHAPPATVDAAAPPLPTAPALTPPPEAPQQTAAPSTPAPAATQRAPAPAQPAATDKPKGDDTKKSDSSGAQASAPAPTTPPATTKKDDSPSSGGSGSSSTTTDNSSTSTGNGGASRSTSGAGAPAGSGTPGSSSPAVAPPPADPAPAPKKDDAKQNNGNGNGNGNDNGNGNAKKSDPLPVSGPTVAATAAPSPTTTQPTTTTTVTTTTGATTTTAAPTPPPPAPQPTVTVSQPSPSDNGKGNKDNRGDGGNNGNGNGNGRHK